MAVYTTINDPSAYFQIALYNGNNAANVITNDGNSDLQPDFLWMKERSSTSSHAVFDSSRGVGASGKLIYPDAIASEATSSGVTSFNTDGFTLASDNGFNESGQTNVGWQWKCDGGTTSTNNDGTVSVTLQVNTTLGFSIGLWTSNGTTSGTIGHGLGARPDMIITKERNDTGNWNVIVPAYASNQMGQLNTTNAFAVASGINTVGTSTFTDGDGADGNTRVFYAFKSIQGYSKIGTYTGNGNANGPFIYTGFKPAFTMIKNTQTGGYNWILQDTKRFDEINSGAGDKNLAANSSSAEPSSGSFAGNQIDYLSNGFKLRSSAANTNAAQSYIYMAFAESPFVTSDSVPTTAR